MSSPSKHASSSTTVLPSCSPSTSSRAPFEDITNHAFSLPPSSPALPSLEHGILSSSPGASSLPRTPAGGAKMDVDDEAHVSSSSSPAFRAAGRRASWSHRHDDHDENDEGQLVPGVMIGGRKRARMSAVGLGGEVNGGGGGRERAHLPPALELRVEEQQQQLSQGSRTPAGAQAESSMMGMGMMDFLSSRGNGMSRRGRRTVGLPGPSGLATALSTLNYYPSTLVTSHTDDLYRMPSHTGNEFAPAFVCQFSNEAKRGGRQMMALGSEEGGLEFVDAGKNAQWDREHTRKSFRPHENAIFDLKWSSDDTQIVTSSGAQVSLVIDVKSQRTLATLRGHTSSVKTTIWDPSNPNILASAARDGHINIYDLRDGKKTCDVDEPKKRGRGAGSSGSIGGERRPVNVIKHAHGDPNQKKKPAASARTATRSPTSILYTPQRSHTLASCGTGDGVIKLWDLRMHGSYSTKPQFPAVAAEQSHDPTYTSTGAFGSRGRPHGIASMCLSKDGDRIYALGTDNRIHLHSPLSLSTPSIHPSQVYSHPDLRTSFYSRIALSPCGRYLASGSTRGAVHLFEVGGGLSYTAQIGEDRRKGIVLKADEGGKEIGCVDWGGEGLASVSDDLHVRVWKSNEVASDWLRSDRKSASWSWGGRADWA